MSRKNGNKSVEKLSDLGVFEWNQKRSDVAVSLAQGYTWKETAEVHGISEQTIANWKRHPDFAAEVDRLSVMVDVASRAQRLRIAMRIIRDKAFTSDRDLLDWLKFAQSETDGVKLDLAALAEIASSVADPRPTGTGAAGSETEPSSGGGE